MGHETTLPRGIGLILALALLCGCEGDVEQTAAAMTGGTPARGKEIIRHYGCEACHSIPLPRCQWIRLIRLDSGGRGPCERVRQRSYPA